MTFSTTRAPGTRQLLLTFFLWVPVCIKNGMAVQFIRLVHGLNIFSILRERQICKLFCRFPRHMVVCKRRHDQ